MPASRFSSNHSFAQCPVAKPTLTLTYVGASGIPACRTAYEHPWFPLRAPLPLLTVPGTEAPGSRRSMRVYSAGTSGGSQNREQLFLFCNTDSRRNLLVLSRHLTGLRSLSPSSLTKLSVIHSNREGMLLGTDRRRAVQNSVERGKLSQSLLFFLKKGQIHETNLGLNLE